MAGKDDRISNKKGIIHPEGMRAVRDFTIGLVHEVNNILGVIIGNAHLAKTSLSDRAAIEKYVDEVRSAAEEGRTLMQALSLLAAMGPTWGEALSLNDVVADAASGVDGPVRLDLDEHDPMVELNPSLAHDAVLCLLRFMAESKGVTSIDVVTRTTGSEVTLTLEDDGTSMSNHALDRLFTPFAKLDGRPKTGLSLTKLADLASRFGGEVTAKWREPQGLRITMTLPVAPSGDGPGVTLSQEVP